MVELKCTFDKMILVNQHHENQREQLLVHKDVLVYHIQVVYRRR